jgi:hypothetical protein
VFLVVGLFDQTRIHAGLVLKGWFELSWMRKSYPFIMFHRLASGIRASSVGEARDVFVRRASHTKWSTWRLTAWAASAPATPASSAASWPS